MIYIIREHSFLIIADNSGAITLECSVCQAHITFLKGEDETPHVTTNGDDYVLPDNSGDYLDPCEGSA